MTQTNKIKSVGLIQAPKSTRKLVFSSGSYKASAWLIQESEVYKRFSQVKKKIKLPLARLDNRSPTEQIVLLYNK